MSELTRDQHEMLTDILIEAIYGYHCVKSGKEFSRDDAINEYLGRWNYSELSYPVLRSLVQGAQGRILDLIKQP
tara:strand:+ start:310 stop:531 length:222 start_codon:yes stop_codon:yes gene_type:complete